MCEAKVYIKKEDRLELLMEDVIDITPQGPKLILTDILGKTQIFEGQIVSIGLLDHKVILEKS